VDVLRQTVSACWCMHGTSPLTSLYLHPCASKQQVTCSLLLFQTYVPTFQKNVQLPPSMQKATDTYILNNKYHSPEHHNLNIYHCEKLKSHKNVYGNSIITSSYILKNHSIIQPHLKFSSFNASCPSLGRPRTRI